ncbi:MAG: tRNA adenosine(34) deaminase TadA [Deltaproteobacteria bacterium]|nr:tRNA adenosine(34) deaminase TadA [Deltaproteobacteria bacterium]HCH66677.1 tRNA adenosine(34) deaminase TadA [Deltaproteobacteria bacterium]
MEADAPNPDAPGAHATTSTEAGEVDPLDIHYMRMAIEEAKRAPALGEVPVGAIVVHRGTVVARAHNRRSVDHDPTAHAELIAMRDAARALGDWRLEECTVYVTLEPCPMCAGTMVQARIERCVYGCGDPKAGYLGSLEDLSSDARLNHRFSVTAGVLAEECSTLLRDFFRGIRARKKAERKARQLADSSNEP